MNRLRKHLPLLVALVATPVVTYLFAPELVVGDDRTDQRWISTDPVIAAAQRRTFVLRDSALALRAEWERVDSHEKAMGLTARGPGLELRVDRDVPAVTSALFAAQARAELQRLTATPAYPVVLRISMDSLSTIASYRRATELPERAGAPCVAIQMRVRKLRGGFSGGTIGSVLNVVKEATGNPESKPQLWTMRAPLTLASAS